MGIARQTSNKDNMRATIIGITLVSLHATTAAQHPCLIASYPFDGNALDATGNGHDGTVMGATLAADRFGNANSAYQFDGVNDFIMLNGPFTANTGTVMAWINMAEMSSPNPVFVGRDTTMNGIGIELGVDPNSGADAHRLSYGFDHRDCVGGGCNVFFEIANPPLTPAIWHHVAMTSDGSVIRLYIDCQQVSTYDGSCGDGGGLWFDDLCNDIAWMIGRHKRPLSEDYFTGRIDDLRIYNCALSASELADICDFGNGVQTMSSMTRVRAYPNPTIGVVTVTGLPSSASVSSATIADISGRTWLATKTLRSDLLEFDLSALPAGMYIIGIREHRIPLIRE